MFSRIKKLVVAGVAAGMAIVSGSAMAAVDLTGVTASFADLTTALGTVGGLIIAAAGTAIVFKWVKGMIFS